MRAIRECGYDHLDKNETVYVNHRSLPIPVIIWDIIVTKNAKHLQQYKYNKIRTEALKIKWHLNDFY